MHRVPRRRHQGPDGPWRGEVVTGSYQAGLEALGRALQNFFKARATGRRVGFPRFRAKGRSHEAIIFQRPRLPDNRHVDLDRRLGPLRTKESLRKLTRLLATDPNARVMRSTVQRTTRGWVISFTVQRSGKRRRARPPNAVVGVDVGLSRRVTLSTDIAARTHGHLARRCGRCVACNASSTVSGAQITSATICATGASSPARRPGSSRAECCEPSNVSRRSTSEWRTCGVTRHTS
jgi:hypothetical protein